MDSRALTLRGMRLWKASDVVQHAMTNTSGTCDWGGETVWVNEHHAKHPSTPQQAHDQRKGVDTGESAVHRAMREKQAQAERSKQLNAQRDAAQHDKALLAQVKQMVAACCIDISIKIIKVTIIYTNHIRLHFHCPVKLINIMNFQYGI